MLFSPLPHGAAGPFDELILVVEAFQFFTFGFLLLRARLRRRMSKPELNVEDSKLRRAVKTRSD
jgi:hypothetical protein